VSDFEMVERTRTVTEHGIWLTVTGRGRSDYVNRFHADWIGDRMFADHDLLQALADQGVWDRDFSGPLLVNDMKLQCALEDAGLLAVETRGGVHGTEQLREWWKSQVH
jgi:hypothetical protein